MSRFLVSFYEFAQYIIKILFDLIFLVFRILVSQKMVPKNNVNGCVGTWNADYRNLNKFQLRFKLKHLMYLNIVNDNSQRNNSIIVARCYKNGTSSCSPFLYRCSNSIKLKRS